MQEESSKGDISYQSNASGRLAATDDNAKRTLMVRQLVDIALLCQGLLKGEQLCNFLERGVGLMGEEIIEE